MRARNRGAVAPAAHAPQVGLGDVLQAEVEVVDAGGLDHGDQTVGEVGGIQVQQADPRHPRGDGADEPDDATRRRARGRSLP